MTFPTTLVLAATLEIFKTILILVIVFFPYRCNLVQKTQTLVSTKTHFIRTFLLRVSILFCPSFDICSN